MFPGDAAVCRLSPGDPVPAWGATGAFTSVTRTPDELSIVCDAGAVPAGVKSESGWAILKLHGPYPFEMVGILASVTAPLAAAKISLFAIATFDTDWVLVKREKLEAAVEALVAAGHRRVTA